MYKVRKTGPRGADTNFGRRWSASQPSQAARHSISSMSSLQQHRRFFTPKKRSARSRSFKIACSSSSTVKNNSIHWKGIYKNDHAKLFFCSDIALKQSNDGRAQIFIFFFFFPGNNCNDRINTKLPVDISAPTVHLIISSWWHRWISRFWAQAALSQAQRGIISP